MNAPSKQTGQDKLEASSLLGNQGQSWEERLLPYLLAGMDACWFMAILLTLSSFGFPRVGALLLPLWSPFLFLLGVCWLVRRLLSWSDKSRFSFDTTGDGSLELAIVVFLHVIVILGALTLVWFLGWNFWMVAVPTGLLIACGWHGFRYAQEEPEARFVNGVITTGCFVLVLCLFINTFGRGAVSSTPVLILLLALFFCLILVTKTLAKVSNLRQRFIDEQSFLQQQPIRTPALLLIAIVASILFLGIALGVGGLFNPSFLMLLQQVFLAPFAWFFQFNARSLEAGAGRYPIACLYPSRTSPISTRWFLH